MHKHNTHSPQGTHNYRFRHIIQKVLIRVYKSTAHICRVPLRAPKSHFSSDRRRRTMHAFFEPWPRFTSSRSSLDCYTPNKCLEQSTHIPRSGKPLPSLPCAPTLNLESWCSFRDRCAQDLCPEETALCPLDDLLVDGLWGVVHDDCAGLVVDLGVDTGVADEVDDPLLTLVL
jgi:hypothetical protein